MFLMQFNKNHIINYKKSESESDSERGRGKDYVSGLESQSTQTKNHSPRIYSWEQRKQEDK